MELNRRRFLQGTGWGFFSLTLAPYLKAIAAPTPRKLALLVGVDRYGDTSLDLKGCVADVELQKELLLARFGFKAPDILTLTNEQATRAAIETAFLEHLVAQAQAGDVVVFHFSGYGHQVQGSNGLLPGDGLQMPQKIPSQQDILETTLTELGRSLPTDKFTLILDTSYQSVQPVPEGNLRSRSFPLSSDGANAAELALQKQLAQNNGNKKPGGIVLKAASPEQTATEIRGDGWSAGLFTYALTQYLWQVSSPSQVSITFVRASEAVAKIRGGYQRPQLLKNTAPARLTYFLIPESNQGAEGLITDIDPPSSSLTVFLGGLPPFVLDYCAVNSTFDVIDRGTTIAQLQLQSRQGLKGKGISLQPQQPLQVGQKIQEAVRVLPKSLKLILSPDSSLSRIERVDATSAISTIAEVVAIPEQQADILLSRVSMEDHDSGYGLSTLGGFLLADTLGPANEAVKSALRRLTPQLHSLLAAKYWHLTLNEGSSRLRLGARLEKLAQTPQTLIFKQTRLGATSCQQSACSPELSSSLVPEIGEGLAKLRVGTFIHYHLENYESDTPIYCLMVGLDTTAKARALVSPTPLVIPPGQSQKIPPPSLDSHWRVAGPPGFVQTYIICSKTPFTQAQRVLESEKPQAMATLNAPLALTRAILEDLNTTEQNLWDSYALALERWATFTFIYQVTN